MKKIGILPNVRKDVNFSATKKLISILKKENCKILMSENLNNNDCFKEYLTREDMVYRESDFLIVLGGDGTMLSCCKKASRYKKPILGINLGHLGFLTDCTADNMEESIKNVFTKNYKIEKRMLLNADINSSKDGKRNVLALNEVSISRGSMVDVSVYVNDEYIDNFFGDGILISTPTGSTAYNLSAGGPILKSDGNMMTITPICPHMLHSRTIVIGGEDTVTLKVKRFTRQKIFAVVDGQNNCMLDENDTILINKSKFYVEIIKTKNTGFYDVLRDKLMGRGER